jgi:murein L,D-transpeptidase YafK
MVMAIQPSSSFKATQLRNSRVKNAYTEKEQLVQSYFEGRRFPAGGFHIFLRAFKKEGTLEVWMKLKGSDQYTLLTQYDICSTSGEPGPKRKEGDLQVPEGVYHINHFNPLSNFHLSLGINYPNASDKILSDRKNPGGAIYIHGNCVTIGCLPITDEKIKEVYVLAVEARSNGQEKIPVHIFPARLSEAEMKKLSSGFSDDPTRLSFWRNLKLVYDTFEKDRKIPVIKVNAGGQYYF